MPTNFQKMVYNFVSKIPKSKVATYKEVAAGIGRPKAYRAVGNALNKNPLVYSKQGWKIPQIPCHRVIKSNGQIGGFALGTRKKLELLKKEKAI